jgi:16S rRNA (cytosine967-C5)-methyltransferase
LIAPARTAAFSILQSLSRRRMDLPSAIAASRASLPDERDRALAAEIATGVERWRARLDHLIGAFSKRSLDTLDLEVLDILRLSAYQLLHLTRVPAAAVVDDAVKLTKRARKSGAAGFVNAVLRSLSRARHELPLPRRPADARDRDAALVYLSVTLSHPRWLAARWLDRFGFDAAERWLEFNNAAAPLTLRANRLQLTRDALAQRLGEVGTTTVPGRYAPDALVVTGGHPLREPGVAAGSFVVQDEASQLVTLLAGAEPGRWILDACASPGGKATALAWATGSDGRVVACDVRDRRIALLERTVQATGTSNVLIVQADLLRGLPFHRQFECVLVDAPCSGLGTLRRDPDIRWRRQETDLPVLAASQVQMLRHAAQVIAPGGRLVYATCSSEPEENEDVAAAFLESSTGFTAVDARGVHPDLPGSVVDSRGHLRTSPDAHGLEAFFGAVFQRRRE